MAFLSRERERELIKRWQDHRDERAFCQLLRSFDKVINKWTYRRPSPEDAAQVARIAFLRAMNTFDLSTKGVSLWTHFRWQLLDEFKRNDDTKNRKADEYTVLDKPLSEGSDATMGALLMDSSTRDDMHQVRPIISKAASSLTPRQRMILTASLLDISGPALAAEMGITPQRVYQLEKKAKDAMRRALPDSAVLYLRPDPAPSGMSALFNG